MTQTKDEPASLVPWVIVAVLAYMLWVKPVEPKPVPPPVPPNPMERIEKVSQSLIPAEIDVRVAAFELAADKVKAGEITTDRQLLEFVRSEIEKGVRNAKLEFDRLTEELVPQDLSGVGGVAADTFLRAAAKSWKRSAGKLR
jgi:hypothetical protein